MDGAICSAAGHWEIFVERRYEKQGGIIEFKFRNSLNKKTIEIYCQQSLIGTVDFSLININHLLYIGDNHVSFILT